MKLSALLMLY